MVLNYLRSQLKDTELLYMDSELMILNYLRNQQKDTKLLYMDKQVAPRCKPKKLEGVTRARVRVEEATVDGVC